MRLGRVADAETKWSAALRLAPDYAEVYGNLANLLLAQGEYERAEASAHRAIELNPRLADAYINLAAVQTARHQPAMALQVLDACSPSRPDTPARSRHARCR